MRTAPRISVSMLAFQRTWTHLLSPPASAGLDVLDFVTAGHKRLKVSGSMPSPSLHEALWPQAPVGSQGATIRKCLLRLWWCICLVSARGFLSLRDINTLTYNYATSTDFGNMLAPQLQQEIRREQPLEGIPMYWSEWQALGVVPWHWTETTRLCRTLQVSIQAQACRVLTTHDLGRWFVSLRMASRRCRRHALMAVMHMVHGATAAEAVAQSRSRWVGTMRTLFSPARTSADVRR